MHNTKKSDQLVHLTFWKKLLLHNSAAGYIIAKSKIATIPTTVTVPIVRQLKSTKQIQSKYSKTSVATHA